MDALYHQHVVGLHLQAFAAFLAFARLEVVFGQFHFLSAEKGVKLFVDEL